MRYIITAEYDGRSLLDFIRVKLSLSRKLLTQIKKRADGIMLNGTRVTVRASLSAGDILELATEDEDTNESLVSNPELLEKIEVLYDDGVILAVNKPPFMPSHPSVNHHDDTLANAVAAYAEHRGEQFIFRAVNRLDRNTSGIVIIAKNKDISAKLSASMIQKKTTKKYLALICGNITKSNASQLSEKLAQAGGSFFYDAATLGGYIEAPIKRERESIILRVCDRDGDYAKTCFKVLQSSNTATLVEVTPETGRTHQIRVHFAKIGFPLVFDDLYGKTELDNIAAEDIKYPKRHLLHAEYVSFVNPTDSSEFAVECPPPPDFSYYRILLLS